ncbi:23S rRNA (adenine(2030)-N(6))-methyltransferase RlmJ [Brevundimonas sp. SORGH_AS_0993]|uniref:23S rRNA (adenine(2030)-N(6))-methyltransferase RlmJ n=1 Tax=Brevundimonas sp. SORGH_AS_0993 TaxID=3041794 RepID=UPI0027850050|nr:23S rRNA (adenine(2030)-N(6))-methyltransferase RlmJ [Brevundimonas sp. SORGH_AS_0993]MDQ1154048.1 23S rRNA (adenine2030-N6)-methyltransferase [Brevundimonas sp. SORGH_AS_0993]
MNYRHSFHAGNFADLVKHALVLWLVQARQAGGALTVLDTHAGAGLYDLSGDAARSREAEAGVARLMTAQGRPPLLDALAARVAAVNPDGGARYYPGSPLLIADALKPGGLYLGFELNPPVLALLEQALSGRSGAQAQEGDGYDGVIAAAARAQAPLILIDPPFEKPDDYIRSARTAVAVVRRDPAATVAIWTPLKDLETFDAFIRRLQGQVGPTLVAEARLRPLTNPMKMNGCALIVVNPPAGAEVAAQEVCGWVAGALGEAGGRAEVWTF